MPFACICCDAPWPSPAARAMHEAAQRRRRRMPACSSLPASSLAAADEAGEDVQMEAEEVEVEVEVAAV